MKVKYKAQCKKYWPEVEQFFSNLPPHLYKQGVLLKNSIATFYSDTGQFKDILSREHDLPLLYLHLWLLDDLQIPASEERTLQEKHLFLAMVFSFTAVYAQQCILDESSNIDNRFLFLERAFIQKADFHLARLFPAESPFWQLQQSLWQTHAEAVLRTSDRSAFTVEADSLSRYAEKLAFTKIPAAAIAVRAGQEATLPQLNTMLEQFNVSLQIIQDIATIRHDLLHGIYTYPIIRTMAAADIDPHQPLNPDRILGALVMTGVIQEIGQACLSRLAESRAISESLSLPTFSAHWSTVETHLSEVMALFSLKTKAKPKARKRPFFRPAIDTVPTVIQMAEDYLLSDLTFRESWEVQRRGVFGLAEMTGKAFPSGLIIETLSHHGHDMSGPIDAVFETLQATGFRYYDHDHLPPDADDLGLLLRLYSYSTRPKLHHQIVQAPLGWLVESVREDGEIPVWLTVGDGSAALEMRSVSLWGSSCATVEASVLLGLINYDWSGYQPIIEKSALNLCKRLMTAGLGATMHYVPLYSLWIVFELITKLGNRPISKALRNGLGTTAQTLKERLALELKRVYVTPQDAAFLMLACHAAGHSWATSPLLKADWLTRLTKTQRYDGSWAAEALFGTPTRGELATWYSSRTVTTAYCYHALKTYVNQF